MNSLCRRTSATNFANDTFPRVQKLVLYLGRNIESNPDLPNDCAPNAGFWSPFLNGESFPDLKSIQIHHCLATNPVDGANIMDQAHHIGDQPQNHAYPLLRQEHRPDRDLDGGESLGPCLGLEKLQEIFLESPPELNSFLLRQILDNQVSKASKLKKLELRFCNLETQSLAFLLEQEIPSLTHFTLLTNTSVREPSSFKSRDHGKSPHLCSLMRRFSRDLVYLKYAASHVCRELFFDEFERHSLKHITRIHDVGNDTPVDTHAIRQAIGRYRAKKALQYRNDRVDKATSEAQAKNPAINISTVRINTELDIDREEQARRRHIEDSRTRWKRSIICWSNLCDGINGWAELQLGADMGEVGVEWILTSRYPDLMSWSL